MRIKIDAFDTLFFRDGKPFTMGAETWGNSLFPPYPSIIYGALRSAYFSHNVNELSKANTDKDPTKNLIIKGLYFQYGIDIFSSAPLDYVREKDKKEDSLLPLNIEKLKFATSCKTAYVLKPKGNKEVELPSDAWISSIFLREYLSGNKEEIYYIRLSNIVLSEPKIGIGRNNLTKTAEDSMLYRAGMKRLKDASIVVDFEELNLPEKGLMKLGGEGRPVYYSKMEETPVVSVNFDVKKLNKIKLYLASPAVFEKGWLPDGIGENSLEGEINGIKLSLLTCAIGKPLYIGGFDMAKKEPKPMKRAVPAGSIYYFELLESYETNQLVEKLHNISILKNENYRKQGFGITYLGRIE
jgi:CRISPR-associated protein Cmr3